MASNPVPWQLLKGGERHRFIGTVVGTGGIHGTDVRPAFLGMIPFFSDIVLASLGIERPTTRRPWKVI